MNQTIRRVLTGLTLLSAVALSGCFEANKSVLNGGSSLTATVTNPLSPMTIYQVKNAYAAADQIVVSYRSYCWARPYAVLMADPVAKPVCTDRRARVRLAQSAKAKASAAIGAADKFVRNNPMLSATTLVNAAWVAVSDFRAAVPTVQ